MGEVIEILVSPTPVCQTTFPMATYGHIVGRRGCNLKEFRMDKVYLHVSDAGYCVKLKVWPTVAMLENISITADITPQLERKTINAMMHIRYLIWITLPKVILAHHESYEFESCLDPD